MPGSAPAQQRKKLIPQGNEIERNGIQIPGRLSFKLITARKLKVKPPPPSARGRTSRPASHFHFLAACHCLPACLL